MTVRTINACETCAERLGAGECLPVPSGLLVGMSDTCDYCLGSGPVVGIQIIDF